jgi:RNA polymerase sigma factor (sigma-70 family)
MSAPAGEQVAAWVEAARGGDRAAFGCLVRAFQDAVGAVLLARIGRAESEDLAQDAFVTAFERLDRLREPSRFGPWVCGIARNLARKWVRDGRRSEPLPDDLRSPSGERERDDMAERVLAAVSRLPERLREPVTLFYIDGFTADDVAGFMEIPPGTVRRRLHEARGQLKELLESEDLSEMEEVKRHAPADGFAHEVLDRIAGIRLTNATMSRTEFNVAFLTDEGGRSLVVPWLGDAEPLRQALGHAPPGPRPTLYDLMLEAMQPAGATLKAAQIVSYKQPHFAARLVIARSGEEVALDALVNDAVTLAARAGVEPRVARGVTREACPDFDHPPRPEDVLAKLVHDNTFDTGVEDLIAQIEVDHAAHREVVRPFTLGAMRVREAMWWESGEGDTPAEDRARRAVAELELAVPLLREAMAICDRLKAWIRPLVAISLAEAECLRGDWHAAAAAFDAYIEPWSQRPWWYLLSYAIALHRTGRAGDALLRLTEACAAIDEQEGREPLDAKRLRARAALADLAARAMPDLIATQAGRAIFGPLDPPCLLEVDYGEGVKFGRVHRLGDRALTVGSAVEADICVEQPGTEPRHARISPARGGWWIEDLGTEFGTGVSLHTIAEPTALRSRDIIRVGLGSPGRHVHLQYLDMEASLAAAAGSPPEELFAYGYDLLRPQVTRVPVADAMLSRHIGLRSESFPEAGGVPPGPVPLRHGARPPRGERGGALWAVERIVPAGDRPVITLTLRGDGGRACTMRVDGPLLIPLRQALLVSMPAQPNLEHLAHAWLNAIGMRFEHLVIPKAFGGVSARAWLRGHGQTRSVSVDAVQGLVLALLSAPRPMVWVDESDER